MEYFRTVEDMQARRRIREFEDLRGKAVSGDLRKNPTERLLTTTFDTRTAWPEKDKLPPDFNPEQVLEEGKNPGLGIRELHEWGITGKGVRVAIIDQKLLTDHEEYKDKLVSYTEYGSASKEPPSMHGPAVASLLVGERCGVAPGAELVYAAVPSGRDFVERAKALNDIIEKNKTLEPSKKVRVVSCSIGYMEKKSEPGLDAWIDAQKKAKEAGIIVVDVGGKQIDISFGGSRNIGDKSNPENYALCFFEENSQSGESHVDTMEDEELRKAISEGDIEGILKRFRETKADTLKDISDEDLRKKIEEILPREKERIKKRMDLLLRVPIDLRTIASNRGGSEYTYEGRGGMSWGVPYLAGIFALALQVNPDLKQEEIIEMIHESAITNKKGLRIINPKGIIELARERMSQ